jgi:hypothetical protein
MNTQNGPKPSFPTIPWRHTRPGGARRRAYSTLGLEHLQQLD